MNIDLHCNIKLYMKQIFPLNYFQQSIAEATDAGLDAIAMTEHFNTNHYYDIYKQLNEHYPYTKQHYYDINGFKVFPGMEIDVAGGGHILVIGERDNILMLRHMLSPHEEKHSLDRKSTRLNSSHVKISYAVFCLKKKTKNNRTTI